MNVVENEVFLRGVVARCKVSKAGVVFMMQDLLTSMSGQVM
jgi:hypothetical protein